MKIKLYGYIVSKRDNVILFLNTVIAGSELDAALALYEYVFGKEYQGSPLSIPEIHQLVRDAGMLYIPFQKIVDIEFNMIGYIAECPDGVDIVASNTVEQSDKSLSKYARDVIKEIITENIYPVSDEYKNVDGFSDKDIIRFLTNNGLPSEQGGYGTDVDFETYISEVKFKV